MKKIAILTDSSTGWTIEEARRYGINIVWLMITFSNGDIFHDNQKEITDAQFYKRIVDEKDVAKTSQTSRGEVEMTFDKLLEDNDHIIYLPIGNSLSGQYSSGVAVSKTDKYKGKVTVIETSAAGEKLKYFCFLTKEALASGKSIKYIENMLEKEKKLYPIYVIPHDISLIIAGGRNQKVINSLVIGLLRIKLGIKYVIEPKRLVITSTIKRVIKAVASDLNSVSENNHQRFDFALAYTTRISEKLLSLIKATFKQQGITFDKLERMPLVVAAHCGDDSFAVFITPKKVELS